MENGEERERPEIAQEFAASRIPVCIYGRHKHPSQAPTGPGRCRVCEENGEITRKPPAVRYGRVMPEYRVINFRERRLSSCVSVALYAPEIMIRSFPSSITLFALREPLPARMLELQLREIGTVDKPCRMLLPHGRSHLRIISLRVPIRIGSLASN